MRRSAKQVSTQTPLLSLKEKKLSVVSGWPKMYLCFSIRYYGKDWTNFLANPIWDLFAFLISYSSPVGSQLIAIFILYPYRFREILHGNTALILKKKCKNNMS